MPPHCLCCHCRLHRAKSSVPVAIVVAVAAELYDQRGGEEVAVDAIVAVAVAIVVVVTIVAITVAAVVAIAFANIALSPFPNLEMQHNRKEC